MLKIACGVEVMRCLYAVDRGHGGATTRRRRRLRDHDDYDDDDDDDDLRV